MAVEDLEEADFLGENHVLTADAPLPIRVVEHGESPPAAAPGLICDCAVVDRDGLSDAVPVSRSDRVAEVDGVDVDGGFGVAVTDLLAGDQQKVARHFQSMRNSASGLSRTCTLPSCSRCSTQ